MKQIISIILALSLLCVGSLAVAEGQRGPGGRGGAGGLRRGPGKRKASAGIGSTVNVL